MKISGLQKMTLLDFPGRVACTVFLSGCNYRCPFCHNSGLLEGAEPALMEEAGLLAFLQRRQGLLDGVCITGGEPTLSPGLETLIRGIRDLGFAVKLDTNGSRPGVLKELVGQGLLDYVAMDVKNAPQRYAQTTGVSRVDLNAVEESLAFLKSGAVDYELRTTVVQELHDAGSTEQMGRWVRSLGGGEKAKRWYVQPFVNRDSVLLAGLHAPQRAQMEAYCRILEQSADFSAIRG